MTWAIASATTGRPTPASQPQAAERSSGTPARPPNRRAKARVSASAGTRITAPAATVSHPELMVRSSWPRQNVEQPVQCQADPVVVEDPDLVGGQPERTRRERVRGLAQAIERSTSQQQVGHDQPHRRRRRHPHPGVLGWQVTLQHGGQPCPVEEVIDQRATPPTVGWKGRTARCSACPCSLPPRR